MSSNVLKIDISEQGEAVGSSVFKKKPKFSGTVVVPQSKKKKRLSGGNVNGVSVPATTQTIKVRVTHTHRHMFTSNKEPDCDSLERDGNHLIGVAQQIKDQKERGGLVANKGVDILKALDDLSTNLSNIDLQKTLTAKPVAAADDDEVEGAHTGLEYGHEPLFPNFQTDSWFDALNNRQEINETDFNALNSFFEKSQNEQAEVSQSNRATILNNTPLKNCRIKKHNLLVDLYDIAHRSFDAIAKLPTKADFTDARAFVRVDASRNGDPDFSMPYLERMRLCMDEDNNVWARVYKELQRHGNSYRSETSSICVAEKTELFVRCSDFRKEFFMPTPTSLACRKICGSYGIFTILENPNLFVLPNSGMWSQKMQQRFGKVNDGSYLEFIDFERARVRLVSSDPFITDPCWIIWNSCGDKIARCSETTMHNEVAKREAYMNSPNACFYESPMADFKNNCVCEKNGTIVLCSNAKHMTHIVDQQTCPVPGKRMGSDNMCVVASEVFGSATRERWILLRTICGTMPAGRHDELLVKTFLESLENDKNLCGLVPCLREFGVEDQSILRTGKVHDEKVVDRLGSRVRVQKKLPVDSHGRERFFLYDPMEMTLALLIFVEARMTAGWYNVWRVWVSCVQTHSFCCPFCSGPISESLYRFVVYNTMIPVLPVTMATMLEQFAQIVRCNRDLYR